MSVAPPKQAAHYGEWPSTLTAEALAAASVKRSEPHVLGNDCYWVEQRPASGGRSAVVRRPLGPAGGPSGGPAGGAPDVAPSDVAGTEDTDIRTRVHSYGGAAWLPLTVPGSPTVSSSPPAGERGSERDSERDSEQGSRQCVIGSSGRDGRLWLFAPGAQPQPITPEPPHPNSVRYADGAAVPHTTTTVWVRETHDGAHEDPAAINDLVAVDLDGTVTPLASGADFYASPRPSPNGTQLALISWDHPNMPWDETRLEVIDLGTPNSSAANHRVVASGSALAQPVWSPTGELHVVDDSDGWWTICRARTDASEPTHPAPLLSAADVGGREFGVASWTFGNSSYVFDASGHIWCTYVRDGVGYLARLHPDTGALVDVPCDFTSFAHLVAAPDGGVIATTASWTTPSAITHIAVDGTATQLSPRESTVLEPDAISVPQIVEFGAPVEPDPAAPLTATSRAAADTTTAHAFYFPPASATHQAPPDELPPLIVVSHGGPTGNARSHLDLGIQFFTNRGFGVVDVNYRGSTGYGTPYRQALNGQWGVVDVADCVAAAQHLATAGLCDPKRLAIKGGSAGGFTTLCALCDYDLFAVGLNRYGVADLIGLARDTHKFEARYLDRLVGELPADEAIYHQRSPIERTHQLSTPTLVLQGDEDPVVPPQQSQKIVDALDAAGVPHAYVLFAGEQHGFRQAEHIIAAQLYELSFLGQMFGVVAADELPELEVRHMGRDVGTS